MLVQPPSDEEFVSAFEAIALEAGRVAYELFKAGCEVGHKADASPVTEADWTAETIILKGLAEAFPDIPVVAEEAVSAGSMPDDLGDTFLLVDPLDGTREFVKGKGDFTVNIALIENGVPILGVVHLPASKDTFIATRAGSFAQYGGEGKAVQITCRRPPEDGLTAIASKNHLTPETGAYLARLPVKDTVNAGSSLKFCCVAEGKADVYPRFGPTMEWDTAAGHAILLYAGGEVVTEDGQPLRYGKPELRNPNFIARGPGVPDPS